MPLSAKYGRVTVENDRGFDNEEPVFLLRARDITSVAMLELYRNLVNANNSPLEHIQSVGNMIDEFTTWQEQHPGLLKRPD